MALVYCKNEKDAETWGYFVYACADFVLAGGKGMMKSCPYCGRIHQSGYVCPKKPKCRGQKNTDANRFRHSNAWTKLSRAVRERDHYLCQCCVRMIEGTYRQYNYDDIEVHHITPIEEDYDRRMDSDNLISLCRVHHEMAEKGELSRQTLYAITHEQEESADIPPISSAEF